jgi:hypothetical protein
MIPPLVKSVEVLRPYVLRVVFDDGAVREVDMGPMFEERTGPVLEPLRDPELFAQVAVEKDGRTTICWPTGMDIDPYILYGIEEADTEFGPGPAVKPVLAARRS